MLEEASIISIFLIALTMGIAGLARAFGLRLGVQHEQRLSRTALKDSAQLPTGAKAKHR